MSFNSPCAKCNNIQGNECNKESTLMEKLQKCEFVDDVFGARKVGEILNVPNATQPNVSFKGVKDQDLDGVDSFDIFMERIVSANNKLTDFDFFNAFQDDFDDADIN
ncbi:hypothetical protein RIF29_04839 [Crotalaria pallida]|uniref:Uncharacterized protein n=1 Tax=Crotalaria pallida TaxID=3830 RepID=A0AAN9J1L0_CROPI